MTDQTSVQVHAKHFHRQIDGYPIVDAGAPIKIAILPEDIITSDRQEPNNCVMARACRRALHCEEVRVHLSRVFVRMKRGKQWLRYDTPRALRTEIVAWDRGGTFEPGTFILKPPRMKTTGAQTGSETNQTRPKKDQKPRGGGHYLRNVRVHA